MSLQAICFAIQKGFCQTQTEQWMLCPTWHVYNRKPYRETTYTLELLFETPYEGRCALKKQTINNLIKKSPNSEEPFIPLKCEHPFTSTTPALPWHVPAQFCLRPSYSGVIRRGMTQQEKRPVHCETCYSLSYSVTAPLPAARRCRELVPMGTNHTDHLTAPRAQGEQKVVEHDQPFLHHCKSIHLVESSKCLGSLRDEGQTATVGLNMQCDCSHQFSPGSLCVLSHGARTLRT